MKQVSFAPGSLSIIRQYIFRLKMYYFQLYTDTWLWHEDWILDEYDKKTELLIITMIDVVTKKLSHDLVPYEQSWDKKISVFVIENRRLRVTYTESDTGRVIEDIEIQYR